MHQLEHMHHLRESLVAAIYVECVLCRQSVLYCTINETTFPFFLRVTLLLHFYIHKGIYIIYTFHGGTACLVHMSLCSAVQCRAVLCRAVLRFTTTALESMPPKILRKRLRTHHPRQVHCQTASWGGLPQSLCPLDY